jgi:polyisoprenoid-binding protein YceI
MNATDQSLVLDAGNTRVTFEIRWFRYFPIRGVFMRAHGTLAPADGRPAGPELRLDVDASTVKTGLDLRDRHLRSSRFLYADLHPYISFRSNGARRQGGLLVVEGTLSLRGIEAPVRSTCPIDEIRDEGQSVELCGNIVVSRRRFGVGTPRGLAALNPLFLAIADDVHVHVRLTVPAVHLAPALRTAAGD